MSRLRERLDVFEAYLVSHYNPVLHPHVSKGRKGGGEFARKSGKLRDSVGEFAGPSGEWKSTLDRHMIDYEHGIPSQNIPSRSLSKTSQTEHVQRIFHGSTHVDYSETPFFKQLEALQGSKNPGRETGEAHQAQRDALFAKQPLKMIPTKGLILTQPNVNRANVLREKATVLADPKNHPAYAVKYGGKFYIMDGHHRLAAAVLDHAQEYPARVLDLDAMKKRGKLAESSLALPFVGSPLHAHFNPAQHPRGRVGRFVDILGKLERAEHGSTVTLPHGITLRRDARGIAVRGGHHSEVELGTTHAAAAEALFRHDMHPDEKAKLGVQGHAQVLDELTAARRASAGSDLGDVEHLGKRQNEVRLSRRVAQDSYLKSLSPDLFKAGGGGRVFSTADGRARIDQVLDKIHVRAKDKSEMAAQDDHLNQILRGRANEPVGGPDFGAAMQKARAASAAKKPAVMWEAPYVDVPFDKTRWPKIAKIEARSFGSEDFVVTQQGGKHPDSGSWGPKGHLDVSVGYAHQENKVDNARIGKALDAFHAHVVKNPDWAMEGSTGRDQNARYSMGSALSGYVAGEVPHPTSESGKAYAKLGLAGRKNEPVPGQTALFDKSILPSPGVKKPTGRKNQATSWWLQNTPEGKRMLGRMGVAGYRNGPLEFKDLDHGDHFVYDSARPKLPGVHRKVGHHAATDETGVQSSRHPFDRVRKVPAPRGRKNEEVGFEGVGDFNGDPFERYAAHQAAKGGSSRYDTLEPMAGKLGDVRDRDTFDLHGPAGESLGNDMNRFHAYKRSDGAFMGLNHNESGPNIHIEKHGADTPVTIYRRPTTKNELLKKVASSIIPDPPKGRKNEPIETRDTRAGMEVHSDGRYLGRVQMHPHRDGVEWIARDEQDRSLGVSHPSMSAAQDAIEQHGKGRKNEAVGGTLAWMKKPMTHEHIMAFLNGGPEGTQVTQAQYVAAKKDGLAGMLNAGAVVRPEHAAALEKAGYWPKQKGRKNEPVDPDTARHASSDARLGEMGDVRSRIASLEAEHADLTVKQRAAQNAGDPEWKKHHTRRKAISKELGPLRERAAKLKYAHSWATQG